MEYSLPFGVQLSALEVCLHCSLFCILLLCMCCGRRIYWAADALVNLILGLAVIGAGKYVLKPQTDGGSLDGLHWFVLQAWGLQLIANATEWFLVRNSNDDRMFARLFVGRLTTCAFVFVGIGFSTYQLWDRKSLHFNEKFPLLYCAIFGMMFVAGVIHWYRNWPPAGVASLVIVPANWLHLTMTLDFLLLMFSAAMNFAFPTQILKTLMKPKLPVDGVHVCLWRLTAAMMFGSAVVSSGANEFSNMSDQKSHVLARMLAQTFHFGWNLYGHFHLDVFSMYHVTPLMLSGFFITFLLSVYFRFPKPKQSPKVEGAKRQTRSKQE